MDALVTDEDDRIDEDDTIGGDDDDDDDEEGKTLAGTLKLDERLKSMTSARGRPGCHVSSFTDGGPLYAYLGGSNVSETSISMLRSKNKKSKNTEKKSNETESRLQSIDGRNGNNNNNNNKSDSKSMNGVM